jgi:uncharacterized membrane protein YgaE (UPF0421/DUF939 family)
MNRPQVHPGQPILKWKRFLYQALMTSLAAAVSLSFARAAGLSEAYWSAISAILVMQSDFDAVERGSENRLAGAAIGAVTGTGAALWLGESVWSFALAVLFVTLVCAAVGRWETHRFAAVTVAIVMLVGHHEPPWTLALHRFLEVSFGIVTAFALSLAGRKLRERYGWGPSRVLFLRKKRKERKPNPP